MTLDFSIAQENYNLIDINNVSLPQCNIYEDERTESEHVFACQVQALK
jgi:uncharacterized protein YlaN (UPF0358 family)